MSGSIAQHHGWKSFFWLETGLSAFAIVMIATTFPETKYHRRTEGTHGRPKAAPDTRSSAYIEGVTIEKPIFDHEVSDSDSGSGKPGITGRGRPSAQQFMPFQKPDERWRMFIVRDTWTPIRVFFNPIIFWAGLMLAGPADAGFCPHSALFFAILTSTVLFFNITESVILSAPPYNLSPEHVGYTNFAFVIGALIGLATAGPYSDWIAARATRKNNGIREAEMRLPALIPYMIITMLSLILGGVAYQQQWAWGHIVVWGFGLAGLSVTTVPTICIAYAIDCYKPISGEIMVVATVCKNFIAFSYSYWIFDVAHASKDGWITPAMAIFACTVGPALFAVPLYYGMGKSIRRWTRNSDLHRMEDMI